MAKDQRNSQILSSLTSGGKYFGKFFNAEVITGNADNKQLIKPEDYNTETKRSSGRRRVCCRWNI